MTKKDNFSITRYVCYIFLIFLLLSGCANNGRALKEAEAIMIENPDSAFTILTNIDTLSLSESQKQRRALLLSYFCIIYVWPIEMTPSDLNRAMYAFDGDCSAYEVKSLILKSEDAKYRGNPVERLELLKDAEFLASQLNDKLDLAFVYFFLSKAYSNVYNGVVSEYYGNKSYGIFEELGHKKQSIDARMAIIGAISVKRDYKVMLDSLLSLKKDVMAYSTESYKQYFFDQLARSLDEDERSYEAIEIWKGLPIENTENSNTLAHWASAYSHINNLDSAESLIMRAIALPHNISDEYLCRNVQYQIWERLGRKSELSIIDSLRTKAANLDYDERKLPESSLAVNKKNESVTQTAWSERDMAMKRTSIFIGIAFILLLTLVFAIIYYRNRNKMLRIENENNLLKLTDIKINLIEKEHQQDVVAHKISELFKSRFNIIDRIASAFFESHDTGSEQRRILIEAKKALADFSSHESLEEMENILNTAHNDLMKHFDEDFPRLSSSQRKLALFIFCRLSLPSISVFQNTDIRNIYVYKSRLKSTIAKSNSPYKEQYLSFFS